MIALKDAPRPLLEALRAELGPVFANPQQEQFFDSKAPEILYSGAMGAGKSRILCEKAWNLALRYPGVTGAIFRKVASSLPATTMRTFFRDVADPSRITSRNRSENWVELDNGSRIYFLGLDPDPITGVPSKVGSLDLAFAYVDEAVELNQSDWLMLLGRLRDPRMPWHQIGAATNPGPGTHWLNLWFTPPSEKRVRLHATAADNMLLPADYRERVASLGDATDAATRRLILGEWANAEGTIWVLPNEQIRGPQGHHFKRVVAGIDWGFVHAFACEVLGQTGSGQLSVVQEVYEHGRILEDIIPTLKEAVGRWGISMFYADPSEPAYIAQCQRAGLPMIEADNTVDPGLQEVTKAIREGMSVDPSCTGLLAEMPGYTWAPQRGGGFKEEPVKMNDDACDALRYAVMALRSKSWGGLYGAATA